jgi:hypothetical protein
LILLKRLARFSRRFLVRAISAFPPGPRRSLRWARPGNRASKGVHRDCFAVGFIAQNATEFGCADPKRFPPYGKLFFLARPKAATLYVSRSINGLSVAQVRRVSRRRFAHWNNLLQTGLLFVRWDLNGCHQAMAQSTSQTRRGSSSNTRTNHRNH